MYVPLKNESEGSHGHGGEGMAVDNEDVVAHSTIERQLSDDIHSGVPKLKRYHGDVWLGGLEQTTKIITVAPHLNSCYLVIYINIDSIVEDRRKTS